MINDIVFFNHWHNGDVFLSKAYMIHLINELKNQGSYNFHLLHTNSSKLLADVVDLKYSFLDTNTGDMYWQVFKKDDKIYINTWVGAYLSFFKKNQLHSNINTINIIWTHIYYTVQTMMNVKIHTTKLEPQKGIPTTNWNVFDIEPAKKFVKEKMNIILFCNGPSRSEQNSISGITTMEYTIKSLARRYKNYTFVCTHKFNVEQQYTNIIFTDDIFSDVKNGDINEIAYISTFCDVIIGKNSGPYIYCHVKENIERNCTFISVSDRQSDSYIYDFYDMAAKHIYFIGKQESKLEELIDKVILNSFKVSVVSDDQIIKLNPTLDLRNY